MERVPAHSDNHCQTEYVTQQWKRLSSRLAFLASHFQGNDILFSLLRIRRWHWCKPEKWDNSFSKWCNSRILSDGRLLFFSIIVNFSNKNLGWCIFLEYYLLVMSHYFLVFSPSLNAYISIGVIFLNRIALQKDAIMPSLLAFAKKLKKVYHIQFSHAFSN